MSMLGAFTASFGTTYATIYAHGRNELIRELSDGDPVKEKLIRERLREDRNRKIGFGIGVTLIIINAIVTSGIVLVSIGSMLIWSAPEVLPELLNGVMWSLIWLFIALKLMGKFKLSLFVKGMAGLTLAGTAVLLFSIFFKLSNPTSLLNPGTTVFQLVVMLALLVVFTIRGKRTEWKAKAKAEQLQIIERAKEIGGAA